MNSSSKSKSASNELSGARDSMIHGLGATAKADLGSALGSTHPLETSECEYEQTEQVRQLENLRQMQGLHAPLRIHMERNALSKVGHLPCITTRHNLLDDVITGRDETIGPKEVFGKPENHEGLSLPHTVLEKKFGML